MASPTPAPLPRVGSIRAIPQPAPAMPEHDGADAASPSQPMMWVGDAPPDDQLPSFWPATPTPGRLYVRP